MLVLTEDQDPIPFLFYKGLVVNSSLNLESLRNPILETDGLLFRLPSHISKPEVCWRGRGEKAAVVPDDEMEGS